MRESTVADFESTQRHSAAAQVRSHPVAVALCGCQKTAQLLPFAELIDELARAAQEYQAGRVVSPERVALRLGSNGILLSMPAAASDIAIHKLVTVQTSNASRSLPILFGTVTVCETETGRPLCILDGPEVTGRRTAALSMLAIRELLRCKPTEVLLVGTGAQASHHLQAIHAIYPSSKVWVRGINAAASDAFVERNRAAHARLEPCPDRMPDVQVAITLTTSQEPVYNEPPMPGRLVIGVGAFRPDMAELGPVTLLGSEIYVDDMAGARAEAGDLLQAPVDWARVKPLSWAIEQSPDHSLPIVFKSVGTAAWDLAAARVALRRL